MTLEELNGWPWPIHEVGELVKEKNVAALADGVALAAVSRVMPARNSCLIIRMIGAVLLGVRQIFG